MNLVREAISSGIPRMREIRAAVRENILRDGSKVTEADYFWYIANGPIWVFMSRTATLRGWRQAIWKQASSGYCSSIRPVKDRV